jgi:hypothetical protein
MLQRQYMYVASVCSNVSPVFSEACCKYVYLNIAYVSHIYCKCFYLGVTYVLQVFFTFFNCFRYMFQVFHLSSDVCCKYFIQMFQKKIRCYTRCNGAGGTYALLAWCASPSPLLSSPPSLPFPLSHRNSSSSAENGGGTYGPACARAAWARRVVRASQNSSGQGALHGTRAGKWRADMGVRTRASVRTSGR